MHVSSFTFRFSFLWTVNSNLGVRKKSVPLQKAAPPKGFNPKTRCPHPKKRDERERRALRADDPSTQSTTHQTTKKVTESRQLKQQKTAQFYQLLPRSHFFHFLLSIPFCTFPTPDQRSRHSSVMVPTTLRRIFGRQEFLSFRSHDPSFSSFVS